VCAFLRSVFFFEKASSTFFFMGSLKLFSPLFRQSLNVLTFLREINTVTGKRMSLPCKSSDTVGDMKEKFAEQLECPTDCLK
jgi:hypothetical protein